MNNTDLYVNKQRFELLCIGDYLYFIYLFYNSIFIKNPSMLSILKNSLFALSDKLGIKDVIILHNKKITIKLYEVIGSELIDKWFSILESTNIDPKSIFTGELFKWLIDPNKMMFLKVKINKSSNNVNNSASNNVNNSATNQYINKPVRYFSNVLKERVERKKKVEIQNPFTLSIPEFVEEEYYTNKLNEFTNQFQQKPKNNTSGTMSSILVSPDGKYLFKQTKSGYKKYHSNECQVYNFLQKELSKFVEERTLFVRCYKNGILLRNGGISLYQMIKEKTIPNIKWFEKLFDNIKILHLLGVVHNDLNCKNIVGDHAFLIDFGLARISKTYIDEDIVYFLNFIDEFFFNLFNIFYKIKDVSP
jgi:hypothetical protein